MPGLFYVLQALLKLCLNWSQVSFSPLGSVILKVHISQHIGRSQYRAQYSYVPVRLQLNDLIGFYSLDHRIAGENQPGLQ